MAEEMGERTELPSGRKRSEARQQGQVARSVILSSGVGLVTSSILIVLFGTTLTAGMASMVRSLLHEGTTGSSISIAHVLASVQWVMTRAAIMLAPMMAILMLVAIVTEWYQVGWAPTLTPLVPNLARLNPFTGFGKLLSKRNAIKSLLSTLKMGLLILVVAMIIRSEWERVLALPLLELRPMLGEVLRIIWRVIVWLLSVMMTIAVADFVYQKWQITEDLRMTKNEVKEEQKMMEGDLEMKGKRLRAARQIALQRIQSSVPKADVVVTNPTHFAVALKYESGKMDAPKVVAKGADFLAFRIREIAAANNVPIVERPPLARALYAGVPVGKQIKPEFYEAVAEILAYVYRIAGKAA